MAKENYTIYTEVDPNNRYQNILANSFDVVGLTRDEVAYIYKNHGAGSFGDLLNGISFEKLVTASSPDRANLYPFGLSNNLGDVSAHSSNNWDSIWVLIQITGTGQRRMGLQAFPGGTIDLFNIPAWGVRYYDLVTRITDTALNKVYLDQGMTSLLTALSISSITTDTFSNLYVANSFDAGNTTNLTGEIANHEILGVANTAYYQKLIRDNRRGRH